MLERVHRGAQLIEYRQACLTVLLLTVVRLVGGRITLLLALHLLRRRRRHRRHALAGGRRLRRRLREAEHLRRVAVRTGLVGEEAGHRIGRRQRQRTGRRCAIRSGAHAHRRRHRHRLAGGGSGPNVGGVHGTIVIARLLGVVHEMAPRSVRTEAHAVEGAAQFGLVLGVALQIAQLVHAVRELAFLAVLALAGLLEGTAQFGLVAV